MNKKSFWLSIIGIIISFVGGFLLANALNRKELDDLQAEVGRLKSLSPTSAETNSEATLTDEEIRQKITEADRNPENIEFQKSLAIALYRYATMKQDLNLLPEVARLLERAYEKNPKDYNLVISLGNIYFDIGQSKNDSEAIEKSRVFYQKALEIKPNETDARTDLGLTYLLFNPPENEKAIVEFQKSLQANPRDERALENIVRAFVNVGKTREAATFVDKLKQANPNNEVLPELDSLLSKGAPDTQ